MFKTSNWDIVPHIPTDSVVLPYLISSSLNSYCCCADPVRNRKCWRCGSFWLSVRWFPSFFFSQSIIDIAGLRFPDPANGRASLPFLAVTSRRFPFFPRWIHDALLTLLQSRNAEVSPHWLTVVVYCFYSLCCFHWHVHRASMTVFTTVYLGQIRRQIYWPEGSRLTLMYWDFGRMYLVSKSATQRLPCE